MLIEYEVVHKTERVLSSQVDLFILNTETIVRELELLPSFFSNAHKINIKYADSSVLMGDTHRNIVFP